MQGRLLRMWDAIIVGLGPAGSTAARHAALKGLKVLGLDKARFPRSKLCAAGLTGRAKRCLPLSPDCYQETTINRIYIHLGDKRPIAIESPVELMTTTTRERLDNALLDLAIRAGVEIREESRVVRIRQEGQRIAVGCGNAIEYSRYVIGCDGANSIVRRAVQARKPVFFPAWQVEYPIPDEANDDVRNEVRFDLGSTPHGYGWIFPKRTTIAVGVAGRFKTRLRMEAALTRVTRLLPVVSKWRPLAASGHAIPGFNRHNRIASGGLLLAGDAAGLVDPFLGEGLYYALRSGELAGCWVADELNQNQPEHPDYPATIRDEFERDLLIAARIGRIVYSFPALMHRLGLRHPGIFPRLADNLTDGSGYTGFLKSLPILWRLLFQDL